MSGLVNYYGRTPESDNILVKPVLLQKGHTKLALYGLSNVRDERLFRTFRDHKVKFFQPSTQKGDWFNLISVHQNHHAYTETGYLPENFLPDFMDLVIWGHEHECLIDPRYNPEMNFHVMQPGSSVATSLMPGEAVPKHVAILSVTGKEFKCETIRLKTVRPFVMKEIVLQEEDGMKKVAKKDNNRTAVTQHLMSVVEEMIKKAKIEWLEAQDEIDEETEAPLPLIRLRVEYSAPEGGKFDCENPQRFSNRFVGKVANVNDVVQFHRKKASATRKTKNDFQLPEESILAQLSIDNVKVEKLIHEFLTAQSLTILPQNSFGDAVSQFVDKDDKHAVEMFVNESLSNQIKHLMSADEVDEEDLADAMDHYKSKLEELFAAGHLKNAKKGKLKPKPPKWDSDMDGEWADQPGAHELSAGGDDDDVEEDGAQSVSTRTPAARGRGKVTASSRKAAATTRNPPITQSSRAKKATITSEEEDDDVVMIDDDEESEEPTKPARTRKKPAAKTVSAKTPSVKNPPLRRLLHSRSSIFPSLPDRPLRSTAVVKDRWSR